MKSALISGGRLAYLQLLPVFSLWFLLLLLFSSFFFLLLYRRFILVGLAFFFLLLSSVSALFPAQEGSN